MAPKTKTVTTDKDGKIRIIESDGSGNVQSYTQDEVKEAMKKAREKAVRESTSSGGSSGSGSGTEGGGTLG